MTQAGDGMPGSGDSQRSAAPPAVAPAAPPVAPPEAAPRPVLSWIAAAGAAIIVILLARTLVAYPLLPVGRGMPPSAALGDTTGVQRNASLQPAATSTPMPTPAISTTDV